MPWELQSGTTICEASSWASLAYVFRKLSKKNVTFTVTERMVKEFEAAKEAMGKNILLYAFDITRRTLVITDASADGFGHILMQKRNKNEVMVRA